MLSRYFQKINWKGNQSLNLPGTCLPTTPPPVSIQTGWGADTSVSEQSRDISIRINIHDIKGLPSRPFSLSPLWLQRFGNTHRGQHQPSVKHRKGIQSFFDAPISYFHPRPSADTEKRICIVLNKGTAFEKSSDLLREELFQRAKADIYN